MSNAGYGGLPVPEEFQDHLPSGARFSELMDNCALDRVARNMGKKIDRGAISDMSKILKGVLSGESTLERTITTDYPEKVIEEVERGDNGIGVHWSYASGRAIGGDRDHGHKIVFTARVEDPAAVDFVNTYCHYQYDHPKYMAESDEEVFLEEGGEIDLLEAKVYKSGSWRSRRECDWRPEGLPVRISKW